MVKSSVEFKADSGELNPEEIKTLRARFILSEYISPKAIISLNVLDISSEFCKDNLLLISLLVLLLHFLFFNLDFLFDLFLLLVQLK